MSSVVFHLLHENNLENEIHLYHADTLCINSNTLTDFCPLHAAAEVVESMLRVGFLVSVC